MDLVEPRPINRVALACIPCRGRHVKCDATQPTCVRCHREGRKCTYEKSRRGGLDKAALARRRLILQQQANQAHTANENDDLSEQATSSRNEEIGFISIQHTFPQGQAIEARPVIPDSMTFHASTDRLLDIYYRSFWPAFPFVLPQNYLNQRRMSDNHAIQNLVLVLEWIGSVYAPWASPEQYYDAARLALHAADMPRNPWSVQALMLFAIGQYHWGFKLESKQTLEKSTSLALELQMNTKEFARVYGEGSSVLEESWRRTYHFLFLTDLHFAVIVNLPVCPLRDVPILVDLPCEDSLYIAGKIPPPATWTDYDTRELEDIETVYSSITYMVDISRIVAYIMRTFMETACFNDTLIAAIDAKLAAWHALLPACKKDPMRADGTLDEIVFQAHFMAATVMMTTHRPFSSLTYAIEELSTESFVSAVAFVEPLKQSRSMHTAKTLFAINIKSKLLAIPCAMENHSVFTPAMVATLATAQIAACNILEDHALSIARDRLRLSIGCLQTIGTAWPLSKQMAKEIRFIARRALSRSSSLTTQPGNSRAEAGLLRDEPFWPINASTEVDIYTGLNLPTTLEMPMSNYASFATSSSC